MTDLAKVTVTFSGTSAEDVMDQVQAMCARGGASALSLIRDDELLAELRSRFAKHEPPLVVKVVPWTEPETTDKPAAEPAAPKTTRTRKATADAGPKAETPVEPSVAQQVAAAPVAPVTEAVAEKVGEIIANATAGAAASVTREDVVAALNVYNSHFGQAEARKMLQQHGGALRLADIPADKFGALIDALKAATPATLPSANQAAAA